MLGGFGGSGGIRPSFNGIRGDFLLILVASDWRLVRQAMTESLLLAFGGCVLGVPLAMASTAALARLQAFSIPLLQTSAFDVAAFGFTFVAPLKYFT